MNYNLEKLCKINNLFNELIFIDLKFANIVISEIISLVLEIKFNIDFLIEEFYFINIIEFEHKKNQIIHKLIFIKNLFFTYYLNNHLIEKINYIKNLVMQVFYPAYLNNNNNSKYMNEIKEIKIKFFHKQETINENLYDDIELEYKTSNVTNNNDNKATKIIGETNKNNKSHNKKKYVINKTKGIKILSNIDFTKSYIKI